MNNGARGGKSSSFNSEDDGEHNGVGLIEISEIFAT